MIVITRTNLVSPNVSVTRSWKLSLNINNQVDPGLNSAVVTGLKLYVLCSYVLFCKTFFMPSNLLAEESHCCTFKGLQKIKKTYFHLMRNVELA